MSSIWRMWARGMRNESVQGHPVVDVAKRLGIGDQILYKWVGHPTYSEVP